MPANPRTTQPKIQSQLAPCRSTSPTSITPTPLESLLIVTVATIVMAPTMVNAAPTRAEATTMMELGAIERHCRERSQKSGE